MNRWLFITTMLLAFSAQADEFVIEKTAKPRTIRLVNEDTAASFFQISRADLPPRSIGVPMQVEQLSWQTTHYPYSGINETIKVCYYPYGDLPRRPVICDTQPATPAGSSDLFKGQPFAYESQIKIHHTVRGSRQTISPAGHDRLTLRISR